MRLAVDTGGTFTDLIVEDDAGELHMFKASTTPADPIRGVLDALTVASGRFGLDLRELLERSSMFIYGTTHALNAVLTNNTARTAFLTTAGHPDVLTLREGGRAEAFNFTVASPDPYIPRSLTWEIGGRMLADGGEFAPLDEDDVLVAIAAMRLREVEAVAVCLLWSIADPAHELRVGELLREHLPGVPFTLSHQLNPTLREYRRASSACIDASLKPMMTAYLDTLSQRMAQAGFAGRTLVVTSQGGVIDAHAGAAAPISLLNSGPS
ncbi:MAG: hydantoinase/oxoprolinase family protein, partial [Variovorax sp.]|nr:hydantoinase/oxoprolinase family protein [Variovorax sp.]